MTPTGTEARVCALIAQRQALGLGKYGTTVEDNPLALRAWMQHALEESLDLAVYLQRSIEELDRKADIAANLNIAANLKAAEDAFACAREHLEPRLVDLICGLRRHQVEEAVSLLLSYIDAGRIQAKEQP